MWILGKNHGALKLRKTGKSVDGKFGILGLNTENGVSTCNENDNTLQQKCGFNEQSRNEIGDFIGFYQ